MLGSDDTAWRYGPMERAWLVPCTCRWAKKLSSVPSQRPAWLKARRDEGSFSAIEKPSPVAEVVTISEKTWSDLRDRRRELPRSATAAIPPASAARAVFSYNWRARALIELRCARSDTGPARPRLRLPLGLGLFAPLQPAEGNSKPALTRDARPRIVNILYRLSFGSCNRDRVRDQQGSGRRPEASRRPSASRRRRQGFGSMSKRGGAPASGW